MEQELYHHGVKGQKWGVRRYQNSDGSRTAIGKAKLRKQYSPKDAVFISGKVSYDKPLNNSLKSEIDKIIKARSRILIGDAPGADTRVQDYLASKGYSNVTVYTTDKNVRNNVGNWNVEQISGNGFSDERSIRRQKDIAMTRAATRGLAIMPTNDRPDSAMSLNVQRMNEYGVPVLTYDFNEDIWHSDELYHHGVKGQRWGVRRYQNKDGSLTSLGQSRYRAIKTAKTKSDVDEIIGTWSKGDRKFFMLDKDEDYLTLDQGEHVLHRILIKDKGIPVSFFDILDDGDAIQVALGTRSGDNYRGKGYAKKATEKMIKWLDKNHDRLGNRPIIWAPYKTNVGSVKLAQQYGFVEDPSSISDDGQVVNYIRRYS